VGEVLYDSQGKETEVLEVFPFQNKPLYRVTFSDSSEIIACDEHLWIVSTLDDRDKGRKRVVDTKYLEEHLKQGGRYNFVVWNPEPLEREPKDLLIDPYILGLWLGDGYSSGYQHSCSVEDAPFIMEQFHKKGYNTKPSDSSNVWTHSVEGLHAPLSEYSLIKNKHIPELYLRGSIEQRLGLLQGLMDSDGCIEASGRCHFHNADITLIEGVQELLSSLGIKYIFSVREAKSSNHKDLYALSFFTTLRVSRLPRKAKNIKLEKSQGTQHRSIKNVKFVGKGDATCFKVDSPDHSFLAGKTMIVTHNCLQFAGDAIERQNTRVYNCSFSLCDRLSFFSESFYLLLCGCGVGFSVQKQHVKKLPPLSRVDINKVRHHVIEDSIEGWADSLRELIISYIEGYYVEFSYHKIRPRGASLITSGGKAPGHYFLKKSLERIRVILDEAQGRKLKPIECHDIVCVASEAVLSGGVRRSACISLFSLDDGEMMTAKTGQWFETYPWRSNANNSVVLVDGQFDKEDFDRLFSSTKEFGEPGFYFTDNPDVGINPCGEACLNPVLEVTEENLDRVRESRDHLLAPCRGNGFPDAKVGDKVTGWQFCDLSETNAALFKTKEDMLDAMKAASIIGTLQAAYTDFPYLGSVSELITRREALIGVSMTGMVDSPNLCFDPEMQREAARLVIKTNQEIARDIDINPAARTCNVKPSGSTSLLLGCVGSGIHAHHSRRYFRRIQANPFDPVYKHFKATNPHMCAPMKPDRDVVTFCVEAPEHSWIKDDLSAIESLEMVVLTQENYVKSGTAFDTYSPGCHHGVSNTIMVRKEEWGKVKDFIWDHRRCLQGLTLLGEF
ncbi:MAG: hypothetical protein GF334_00595, partial [Candidatus Altiarchaeales archaeon]|nr:hypothetical protein [Candidatus Altiarchaeales archaeon]